MGLIIFIARTIGGVLLVYAGFNLIRDYIRYEPPEPQPSPLAILACFLGAAFLLYPFALQMAEVVIELSRMQ